MPEDFPPTGAVNLALINTTPEQLAAMAKAMGAFVEDALTAEEALESAEDNGPEVL